MRILGPAVSLCGLLLASPTVEACPETALGTDTSQAWLTGAEWRREGGVYLLELDLLVVDQPELRTIQVGGEPVEARVEHWTPFTLAHWLKGVGLLFGGASKFVVGAARDVETGEVAVIPFCSLKDLRVRQGADFDGNAPFELTLELACLHPPVPFEGTSAPFEPHAGVGQVGDHWVRFIDNDDPAHFDPYGQGYGDYFADLWYRVSFIHGPIEADEFLTPDDPMPLNRLVMYDPAAGFRVLWPGTELADMLPAEERGPDPSQSGDLYRYVLASYEQLQPTTSLDALVDRRVELAIMGDRSLVPPASPYSEHRAVCSFEEGRFYTPQKNALGFLGELAVRESPSALSWPTVGGAGPAAPSAWQRVRARRGLSQGSDPGVGPSPGPPPSLEDAAPRQTPTSPTSPLRWFLLLAGGGALFGLGLALGRRARRR